MKLQLPNGQKSVLDENLTLEEKLQAVEQLVDEWQEHITRNWDSPMIKYFLDTLANYIVWHKEEIADEEGSTKKDNSEDKEVMSKNKTNRLYRGRKDIVFSSLSDKDKEMLFGERGKD